MDKQQLMARAMAEEAVAKLLYKNLDNGIIGGGLKNNSAFDDATCALILQALQDIADDHHEEAERLKEELQVKPKRFQLIRRKVR